MSILQKDFLIASRHASRDISSFFSGLTSILKTNSDNKQSNYPAELFDRFKLPLAFGPQLASGITGESREGVLLLQLRHQREIVLQ